MAVVAPWRSPAHAETTGRLGTDDAHSLRLLLLAAATRANPASARLSHFARRRAHGTQQRPAGHPLSLPAAARLVPRPCPHAWLANLAIRWQRQHAGRAQGRRTTTARGAGRIRRNASPVALLDGCIEIG